MAHPKFKYTPRSASSCERQRQTMLRKLGVPEGHRTVYGVHVPIEHLEPVRTYARRMAQLMGSDKVAEFLAYAERVGWAPEMPPLFMKHQRDWDLMIELLSENMTREEVAEHVGISTWYLNKMLTERRLEKWS